MKLYDTLSGSKKEFAPLNETVSMYVCGPNLYGPCHIGHALSYVFFDVLKRYLEYQGYKVNHVQNFTDIEDRIIEVASSEGKSIEELSQFYIEKFLTEMDALGIKRANHYPKATDYIDQMITIIQNLIGKGDAYEIDGDVYFRVRHFLDYGKLSRRPIDEMQAGSRIDIDHRKEDPLDFALWKSSKTGEPSWPTPWGAGRPGWHIECSAMSLTLLGNQIDIHGGGQDVIFPHHENEIAQSEMHTGDSPFVQFWLHNGLLRLSDDDSEKMTRHMGNFISCEEALTSNSSDALRMYFLTSHYRSPTAYTTDGISAAKMAMDRVLNALREDSANSDNDSSVTGNEPDTHHYSDGFNVAMDDDLNTPQALASVFQLVRQINRQREAGHPVNKAQLALKEMMSVLGFSLEDKIHKDNDASKFIDILVETRSQLRQERNFKLGDSIRTQLEGLGVTIEDSPEGTKWRFS